MSSINRVHIIGNLGNDPEAKFSSGGNAITTLSVATTDTWRDKQTNEKKEKTQWHKVVFFGKLAEVCSEYLRKGSKVYIEGSIDYGSYEKEGITRYTTEIKGQIMTMLDSRDQNIQSQQVGLGQSAPGPIGAAQQQAQVPQGQGGGMLHPGATAQAIQQQQAPGQTIPTQEQKDNTDFDKDLPF